MEIYYSKKKGYRYDKNQKFMQWPQGEMLQSCQSWWNKLYVTSSDDYSLSILEKRIERKENIINE